MKKLLTFLLIISVAFACGGDKDDQLVVIKTNMGDIKLVLFDETPLHKANFLKLAREGKYDSTLFHRVIDGFMIQGGDVNAKKGSENAVDYTIPAEIQGNVTGKFLHTRGAVAAAKLGDDVNPEKASSGCQFYIVDGTVFEEYMIGANWKNLIDGMKMLLQDKNYAFLLDSVRNITENGGGNKEVSQCYYRNRHLVEESLGADVDGPLTPEQLVAYTTVGGAYHLDGEHTVFGRVVEGMEVVDKIAAVKTRNERPLKNLGMRIELEPMNKSDITEEYGITFPESKEESAGAE
ncbi:MAG: peptidylprolyl isomerase [Bacteroidota bacterium]